MDIDFVFKKEFIQMDLDTTSKEELISSLASPLIKQGIVKHSFPEKVLEREKNFPTGIPAETVGIAIPHTDAEHSLQNGLAIGILKKKAITFKVMGSPDQNVDVSIVFLLALNDSNKHLSMLQNVISLVRDKKALNILKKGTQEEVFDYLSSYFK